MGKGSGKGGSTTPSPPYWEAAGYPSEDAYNKAKEEEAADRAALKEKEATLAAQQQALLESQQQLAKQQAEIMAASEGRAQEQLDLQRQAYEEEKAKAAEEEAEEEAEEAALKAKEEARLARIQSKKKKTLLTSGAGAYGLVPKKSKSLLGS